MASENNVSPLGAEPKPEEQPAKIDEDDAVTKQKDSPISTEDPQCIRHQEQNQKSGKGSWSTWWLSHRWVPFKERPRWVWWTVVVTVAIVVVGVILAGIIFTIYYGLESHDEASLSRGTNVQALPATTSVEKQQPYLIEYGADSRIARAGDIENISTESRKARKRSTQQQAYENLEYRCGEYRKAQNIYCPTGMSCYSNVESPSSIYYCIDDLNYSDTKNSVHGGAENTFQCHRFLDSGCSQIGSKDGYIPPSAHTITATSSTTAFIDTKVDEPSRSDGPTGIRPGFGFSSIPILEVITLCAAVAVAWVAIWRYL
ncbi:hypothetical protein F5Y12DRAFT_717733 [Xylaria sp. FL1777]|nr:hypothetical protein F5Y12DRAFT_717733 [Xylaria sp. FL1777]